LFRDADDEDLRRAARYANGRPFSARDERVLGVSSRIVGDVVRDLLNVDAATLRTVSIRRGELGEAVGELWPRVLTRENTSPALNLSDLTTAFDALAATTQPAAKKPIIRDLLARCVTDREACYLCKIILSDLRTGVREGVLQAAVAEAFGIELKEVLRTQLLAGDLGDVAVLAKHGVHGEAAFSLMHPLQFMLAQPIETPADAPGEWVVEDKLDGIRAQVHKQGDRVQIYTRTLDRVDESFPDVVAVIRALPGDFLLDGEIVPWRDGRALAFAVLQKRLGRKTVSAKQLHDHPAAFVAFDALYLNGMLLLDEPLLARQAEMRAFAALHPALLVLPSKVVSDPADIQTAFDAARAAGNEGLMLKQTQSTYTPGRRGGAWLKLKTHLPTLDCVVTAAEYGHGKRRGSLSDYTFAVRDGDQLVNIGKAFSGVTDVEIAELTALFKGIAVSDNGHTFQVKPQVVLEIAFDQILESKRHASGFAMRFPRIKRIRTDKGPADADTIERVREIYESASNLGRKVEPPPQPAKAPEPTLFD
jgi:DNA ligase-1